MPRLSARSAGKAFPQVKPAWPCGDLGSLRMHANRSARDAVAFQAKLLSLQRNPKVMSTGFLAPRCLLGRGFSEQPRATREDVIAGASPSGQHGPAARGEAFEWAEIGLVGHLAAARDPVAEIEIGQARGARALDEPLDHVGAEAALGLRGLEEAVDRGKPVMEAIDEAGADELAGAVAIFG